jgi:hypothetical protein
VDFLGVEVRLRSRSFLVRRVSPVPVVVSFEPEYRLCAISGAELKGRIMTGCRSEGVSLKGVGQAQVIWVLIFWLFSS